MFDAAPTPDISLMQTPAFAAALRLCGQSPVVLPSGVMVLHRRVLGVPVAMLPRIAPPPDLDEQLCVRNLHRIPILLSPEEPCPIPRAIRLRKPQMIARWHLTTNSDTARKALHPKWRNQLVRSEAAGLRVSHGQMPAKPGHPLLKLETAQAQARQYVNWPAGLTAAFAQAGPEQTRLFTAYLRGTAVAHMLFLLHGDRATYHIGHITDVGKSCSAHNLLLWRASRWLVQEGISALDLGVVDPKTPGLNSFKLRTGARKIQTGGTWLRWHPLARRDRA
jgi:hypothetical protein